MSLRYAFFSFTALLLVGSASGQCDFTPTIVPDEVILCPNESTTLSTQEYDAYQWYKDGALISGATGQTLEVSQFADVGYTFTVAATLDDCTAMSAGVLVDGWMFILPYVIHGGDEPVSTGPFGEQYFCEGQIFTLTLAPGYTENITWTRNGEEIPDEHDPTLIITTSGSYSASAAPTVCPNSVMGIGVEVEVEFTPPLQPVIVAIGQEICPYPTGNSTQWYLNGAPYSTDDCITPSEPGSYTVFVDYGQGCQVISDPWLATGISDLAQRSFTAAPVPATRTVTISWPDVTAPHGTWRLTDMSGRTLRSGSFPSHSGMSMDVQDLDAGHYLLLTEGAGWNPVRIVVAH